MGGLMLLLALSLPNQVDNFFSDQTVAQIESGSWISAKKHPFIRDGMFANATVTEIFRDPEGIHLRVTRHKAVKSQMDQWSPWIDGYGRPWLCRDVDQWDSYYWQANEWRSWRFASERDWELSWNSTQTKPGISNFGVTIGQTNQAGKSFGDKEQPPCPGPGPCPRPNPGPNGPDDFFPIKPSFNLNLDPTLIAGAVLVVGLGGLTLFFLVAILLLRRKP